MENTNASVATATKPEATTVTTASSTNTSKVTVKPEVSTADLMTRVSEVKKPSVDTPTQIDPFEVAGFNRNDIDKITDPNAKLYLENMAKSLQAGYNKKFQDLAEERKKAQQPQQVTWTPERVQAELKNPSFVQAAQLYASQAAPQDFQGTQEEWSALSDSEKRVFQDMRNQLNTQSLQLNQMLTQKEDEQIASRYKNYNAKAVEEAQQAILSGQVNNIREYVWKAVDYEDAIKRAYELGISDAKVKVEEKQNAITTNGFNVSPAQDVVKRQPNESFQSFWDRIKQRNLSKLEQIRTQR